jgi:hypothetical protein
MFANSYMKVLPFVVDYIHYIFPQKCFKMLKNFATVLLCTRKICQLLDWPSFKEGPDPNLNQRKNRKSDPDLDPDPGITMPFNNTAVPVQ